MEWLNYHHLYYFWTAVNEGGIAAASRKLLVGRPSISAQIKTLESFVGAELFHRSGRHLELTDTGRLVFAYADDIFQIGRELVDTVRGRPTGRPAVLRVGVADVTAKLVAFQVLEPALDYDEELSLSCVEDLPKNLFARLALHELDLVISDIPMGPDVDIRAYNHPIGRSTMTLFAAPEIAKKLRPGAPESLDGQPFLMPAKSTAVRRSLDEWLEEVDIRPTVVAEFEDSALLKVFGQAGRGVFPAPTVVGDAVKKQYGVHRVMELQSVSERFYFISPERRIKHPAVAYLLERARTGLFKAPSQ